MGMHKERTPLRQTTQRGRYRRVVADVRMLQALAAAAAAAAKHTNSAMVTAC